MGLEDISMIQALDVWSELEQAYYGDASYGSDTAEIYAYKLQRFNPKFMHDGNWREEAVITEGFAAAKALYGLLDRFCEVRNCEAEIDGFPLGSWFLERPFVHRCHVKIVRKAA